MMAIGPDEPVYPATKIAIVTDTLAAESVAPSAVLDGTQLTESEVRAPSTRVSFNQVIRCYLNAIELSRDPHIAYHLGLRFHLSAYGMYGFAILSSTDFRRTICFMVEYHELATPTARMSFDEDQRSGEMTINPRLPYPDPLLYRFLVDLQFAVLLTLLRDVMGPSFAASALHVAYAAPADAHFYAAAFGCEIAYDCGDNKFFFDAAWLDKAPALGNDITYAMVLKLCDDLLHELQLHAGVAGKVRQLLLTNIARPRGFDAIAREVGVSPRTLRRKLADENTTYRNVSDELRMHLALKYLSETGISIEDISEMLGFSDAANFRHAFRRWTNRAPGEFRNTAMFRAA